MARTMDRGHLAGQHRRWRWPVIGVLVCGLVADVACTRKPEISFALRVPDAIREQAVWYEIGAFSGASCPPAAQLSSGIPPTGTAARVAFRKGTTAPALGDLARGTYAFAAVAKGEDCSVLATGCASADVGDVDDVSITLRAKDPPSPPCGEGTTCQNAQCAPSQDNDQSSVGAGCSLELLGAGPLGNPIGLAGTIMSYPAIVPTDKGFLIAYREYDPIASTARLTFVHVDTGGGLVSLTAQELPGRCSTGEEADAVGLAFASGKGLAIVARASCEGKAGFDLFTVDDTGHVTKTDEDTSANFASAQLSLSAAHAIAPTPDGNSFFLAARRNGQAILLPANDAQFSGPSISFGGAAPHTDAWVTSSDKLTAWLAGGTGTGGPRDGGPESDGGSPQVLRLQMAAAGANLADLPPPQEIPGTWGSLAAQGTRVVVASNGSSLGRSPVIFHVFDLGAAAPTFTDGFSAEGLGKVLFADVAYQKQHAFFAVETPGAISVVAYDQMATNTPVFLREERLAVNPRVPALTQVRDGRLAVAATDTRVGVVWATARTLTEHDATGGYAILACR